MVMQDVQSTSSATQDSFALKYLVCSVQPSGTVQWIGGYNHAAEARRCRDGLTDACVIQHDEDGVDLEWGKKVPNKDRDHLSKKVMFAYNQRKKQYKAQAKTIHKTYWVFGLAGELLDTRTTARSAADLTSTDAGACMIDETGMVVLWNRNIQKHDMREIESAAIAAWKQITNPSSEQPANDNSLPPDPPPHLNAINPPPPVLSQEQPEVSAATLPQLNHAANVQTGTVLPEKSYVSAPYDDVLIALGQLHITPVNQLGRTVDRVIDLVVRELTKRDEQIKQHENYIADLQQTNINASEICDGLTAIAAKLDADLTEANAKIIALKKRVSGK